MNGVPIKIGDNISCFQPIYIDNFPRKLDMRDNVPKIGIVSNTRIDTSGNSAIAYVDVKYVDKYETGTWSRPASVCTVIPN
jgi:hypothetical protein